MYDLKDIRKYEKQCSLAFYEFIKYGHNSNISYETACRIQNYFLKYYRSEWLQARKDNRNYYARVRRLKDKIFMIIQFPSVFLTITFTNDTLDNTNAETRRKYVQRYLKSFNVPFVANRDFGSKNKREHYHAVLGSQSVDYTSFGYGSVNGEKIRYNGNSHAKLAKYILKLSNHSLKDTTAKERLLYSR